MNLCRTQEGAISPSKVSLDLFEKLIYKRRSHREAVQGAKFARSAFLFYLFIRDLFIFIYFRFN